MERGHKNDVEATKPIGIGQYELSPVATSGDISQIPETRDTMYNCSGACLQAALACEVLRNEAHCFDLHLCAVLVTSISVDYVLEYNALIIEPTFLLVEPGLHPIEEWRTAEIAVSASAHQWAVAYLRLGKTLDPTCRSHRRGLWGSPLSQGNLFLLKLSMSRVSTSLHAAVMRVIVLEESGKIHGQNCLVTEQGTGTRTEDRKHVLGMSWVALFPALIRQCVDLSCAMVTLVKRYSNQTFGLGGRSKVRPEQVMIIKSSNLLLSSSSVTPRRTPAEESNVYGHASHASLFNSTEYVTKDVTEMTQMPLLSAGIGLFLNSAGWELNDW
ncbi:hypothetical protein KCU65_g348, partial [Aureobasidium melanogenum]